MKDLKDQVAPILTKIYTNSIETGTIPKDWKHANVAPAFKKGKRYKAENYRFTQIIWVLYGQASRSISTG
jgi:hypothetical protein